MNEATNELITETDEIIQNSLDYTLFSWSKQKGINPIAVKYAQGVYLYDYEGKRYIDFSSGLMNVNIGHSNQRVTQAVMEQMQQVSYVTPSCVTKARGELGKKLAAILVASVESATASIAMLTNSLLSNRPARTTGSQMVWP